MPAISLKPPHRDLPDTGNTGTIVGVAAIALNAGVLFVLLARVSRRRRRRYVVRRVGSWWRVVDRVDGTGVVTYDTKDAARNRAHVLNAGVPSLAETKGWT